MRSDQKSALQSSCLKSVWRDSVIAVLSGAEAENKEWNREPVSSPVSE
jgi:hypothetical protein